MKIAPEKSDLKTQPLLSLPLRQSAAQPPCPSPWNLPLPGLPCSPVVLASWALDSRWSRVNQTELKMPTSAQVSTLYRYCLLQPTVVVCSWCQVDSSHIRQFSSSFWSKVAVAGECFRIFTAHLAVALILRRALDNIHNRVQLKARGGGGNYGTDFLRFCRQLGPSWGLRDEYTYSYYYSLL